MENNGLRKFKNKQKRLAKKIEKSTELKVHSIQYQQFLRGVKYDEKTEKMILKEGTQIYIPGASMKPSLKGRIYVIINFEEPVHEKDKKQLNKILKTQYRIKEYTLTYSSNPSKNFI